MVLFPLDRSMHRHGLFREKDSTRSGAWKSENVAPRSLNLKYAPHSSLSFILLSGFGRSPTYHHGIFSLPSGP